VIFNYPKYHLLELHLIIYIDQKYDSQESYSISLKNMTHESHIPQSSSKIWLTRVVFHIHHPKIWLIRVIFHINKNNSHESHFPHLQKIWLFKVICYISQNITHHSHILGQPKYDLLQLYSTSAKHMTTYAM